MGCFQGWRSGPSQEAADLAPGRPQTKSISSSQTPEARCTGPSQGIRSGQEAGQEGPGVPSPPEDDGHQAPSGHRDLRGQLCRLPLGVDELGGSRGFTGSSGPGCGAGIGSVKPSSGWGTGRGGQAGAGEQQPLGCQETSLCPEQGSWQCPQPLLGSAHQTHPG